MTNAEAISQLMRVHYGFFMTHPQFWYDKALQEADRIICEAASDLRKQCPPLTADVLRTIRGLAADSVDSEDRPSTETIEWAEKFVLTILPRLHLEGAHVDPFAREVHISWVKQDKRVVVLLPGPDQIMVYREEIVNGRGANDTLNRHASPADVRDALYWFFQ